MSRGKSRDILFLQFRYTQICVSGIYLDTYSFRLSYAIVEWCYGIYGGPDHPGRGTVDK
jgi:hypothetical protein